MKELKSPNELSKGGNTKRFKRKVVFLNSSVTKFGITSSEFKIAKRN